MRLLEKLQKDFGVECVDDLNTQKRSLGFVKPTILGWGFEKREDYDPTKQLTLGQTEPFLTIHNYEYQPRVQYRCSGCKIKKPHDQQIIEWGAYERMRKDPSKKEQIWEALGFGMKDWEIKGFLVGNQFLFRNAFMVISVFRFKAAPQKLG